jgi:opacity protein-like surface antigen
MKRFSISVLTLAILVCLVPSSALAQGANYMTFKPGIYSPQSSDLDDFDTGFSGEIAFGHRFNPNVAAEMGVGYFRTDASFSSAGTDSSSQSEASLDVLPITLSLKGSVPVDNWEFFGLVGIGAYWVWSELDVTRTVGGTSGSLSLSETDTFFGFHVGLGLHYHISPAWFIGVEGKYLWTGDAKLSGEVRGEPVELFFEMDGFITTAVLGFNF